MDFDILDSLDDLGYAGPLKSDSAVKDAIKAGPKSKEFTELIEWFSEELQSACGLDSYVNAITDPEDASSFLMEVSSLLKELHCPYKSLVSGPISQRLLDVPSRNVLLDFLCTELQAARLLQCKTKKKRTLEIEMDDSTTATSLVNVMEVLGIPKEFAEDPDSVLPEIEKKVNEKVSARPELISEPAFKASLTEKQWAELENLFGEFEADYTVRRELLITRLDVTIQSFQWGEGS
ncbi:Protein FAM98A, partial [Stegodyphus mimosarum]